MKIFIVLIFAFLSLYANKEFVKSDTCKSCHPTIYSEFYGSAHRKSSIYEDPIHKAIWDIHPLKEKNQYTCAKCHTPTDTKLLENLENKQPALPDDNNLQRHENISCVYCHSIENIEEHKNENSNKTTKELKHFYAANKEKKDIDEKSYKDDVSLFGLMKTKSGSPYHKINYTNKNFYDGNICMGCHSHRQNKNEVDLCRTDLKGVNENKNNCISCHMPKIDGSLTTIKDTKTHSFHGFSSNVNNQKLLEKYIKLDVIKNDKEFSISIKNDSPHEIMLHPLRQTQLEVNIIRENKNIKKEKFVFTRVLGNDKEPTLPWMATKIFKDNSIKENENRILEVNFELKKDDVVEIVLGYYKVNPKMLKKLKLENDETSTKFNIIKNKNFYINK